jgi:prephenate dehydrogenase
MWQAVGALPIEMDAQHHDRVVAAVSHLPHVAAYALAATVGAIGGDVGRDVVGLAGGGFTDTTRIASTPPAMWIDVFLENKEAILSLIDTYAARVGELRGAIERGDAAAIESLLRAAADGRKRILG